MNITMSPEIFETRLLSTHYIVDKNCLQLLKAFYQLQQPLIVEGSTGVGKTSLATVLAKSLDCELIRLRCFEGIGFSEMCYEWDYRAQLLAIKMLENQNIKPESSERILYSSKNLIKKPILQVNSQFKQSLLLVDDLHRADEAFESELLSWMMNPTVFVPHIGDIPATVKPLILITHNGSRMISDSLRAASLFYYLDFPSSSKELHILKKHFPDISDGLAEQIVGFVQELRRQPLQKKPGISEVLTWTRLLLQHDVKKIHKQHDFIKDSLGCLLKSLDDMQLISNQGGGYHQNSELHQ